MSVSLSRILPAAVATTVLVASAALPAGAPAAADDRAALAPAEAAPAAKTDPVLFFAADGMRQDLVEQYADARRDAGDAPSCSRRAPRRPAAGCSPRRRRTPVPGGTAWRPGRGRR